MVLMCYTTFHCHRQTVQRYVEALAFSFTWICVADIMTRLRPMTIEMARTSRFLQFTLSKRSCEYLIL